MDPVTSKFLALQSDVVQEILPAIAKISRRNDTIILAFRSEHWLRWFQRFYAPLNGGEDLRLSFEFRVASSFPALHFLVHPFQ